MGWLKTHSMQKQDINYGDYDMITDTAANLTAYFVIEFFNNEFYKFNSKERIILHCIINPELTGLQKVINKTIIDTILESGSLKDIAPNLYKENIVTINYKNWCLDLTENGRALIAAEKL